MVLRGGGKGRGSIQIDIRRDRKRETGRQRQRQKTKKREREGLLSRPKELNVPGIVKGVGREKYSQIER